MTMPRAATSILFILGLFLAVVGGMAPAAKAADTAATAAAATIGGRDYRLDAGDKLRLTVFGEVSLSGDYVVGATGRMALPLIGEINAKGQTTTEVEKLIETKLKDGYLRDPRVSLEVITYRPFYILGEVNRPGEYPYTADLTVVKAVATANGFTYRANKNRVFIKHVGETEEKPYPAESTTIVAPGDTIRVAERFF
jgi:polysaccharide export outer membrane protein